MERNLQSTDRRTQNVKALVTFARRELGPSDRWIRANGYPDSLALCVVDSIYSTGQHYNAVKNVVSNYKEYQGTSASTVSTGESDGVEELLATFSAVGGVSEWADQVAKNRKPAHTKPNAVLKAEVVLLAAELLRDKGVLTVADLRALDGVALQDLHSGWKALPSQRSGITFNYVLILAGRQSIKVDRMVHRFVANVPGATLKDATNEEVLATLVEVATELDVTAAVLDHVAWRFASNREFLLADPEGDPDKIPQAASH